ncbi:MAG: hypothetical protein BGN87_09040 [Rhizobiales bacterium 65-79]|nr:MAG: hypothetical protein BGN87_09040 [Rhizobiales bacterium 65-79]
MIVSCAALLDTSALLLGKADPESALMLDPLASDIRIDVILSALQQADQDTGEDVIGQVQTGIRLSPIDARFYSLLGILEEQQGDRDAAKELFHYALALLPTEIQALAHMMDASVRAGDLVTASRNMEIIARRWPEYWPKVEAALPTLLDNPEAFQTISDRFGPDPLIRRRLIASMTRNDVLLTPAYRMVLAWHEAGITDLAWSINSVTNALLRARRFSDAYSLFVLTRASTNPITGFVYNGSFSKPLSGSPFDWQIRPQAGADISLVSQRRSSKTEGAAAGEATQDDKAIAVRFLGGPLNFSNISQLTRLTPGSYELQAGYSSLDLDTPEPLKLGLSCQDGQGELGHLDFAPGTAVDERSASFQFSVPAEGCELQRIETYSARLPLSWRYRYEGTLFIDYVRVRRQDG